MARGVKLGETILRDAEPIEGKSYQIFDTEIRGLAGRVHGSGARTFTLDYRHAGRQRRMTIGRWPEWSVTAARERAEDQRAAAIMRMCILTDARAGERLSTSEKTHATQRQMLLAASRRPADRDALARRLRDGRF